MSDREKVIKGLECCYASFPKLKGCPVCPYEKICYHDKACEELLFDAIELLKEQEAVKPKYNARTNWYECGACHHSMTSGIHFRSELIPAYKVRFCDKCGRGVKWE